MKLKYVLLILIFVAIDVNAQNYFMVKKTGSEPEYIYTSKGKTLLGRPSNDVLSQIWQLPFEWTFYGKKVSKFRVSDNGYITFDTTEKVSKNKAMTLPNPSAPKNAIFAFWCDLELKPIDNNLNKPTEVRDFIYTTPDDTVYVIQWFSASPYKKNITNFNFLYFAIRIYKSGKFDVIWNYGRTTDFMTATIGCQNSDGSVGFMADGSPEMDIPFPGASYTGNEQDIIFMFIEGMQPDLDLMMVSSPLKSRCVKGETLSIDGKLANYGKQTITSLTINYSIDGGNTISYNIPKTTIDSCGGVYSFKHPTKFTPSEAGKLYEIKMWASNLNGQDDQNNSNDFLIKNVFANNGTNSTKYTLLEQGTAGWSGYAPDGQLIIRDILKDIKNIIYCSHHNLDSMNNPQSDSINKAYLIASGFPYGMIDRTIFSGQLTPGIPKESWRNSINQRLQAPAAAALDIEAIYDDNTRKLNYQVNCNFSDFAYGDIRIVTYIIEDNVRGRDIPDCFSQRNYYSKQNNTPAGGSSHELYEQPDVMVGYWHHNVVRSAPSGVWGAKGIIPNLVKPDEKYSQSFQYTLPNVTNISFTGTKVNNQYRSTESGQGMNKPGNTKIIAFLYYYDDDAKKCEIINSISKDIPYSTFVEEGIQNKKTVEIYPNPASGFTTLEFAMESGQSAEIVILNQLGETVMVLSNSIFTKGVHHLVFDADLLSSGVYFARIRTVVRSHTISFVVDN